MNKNETDNRKDEKERIHLMKSISFRLTSCKISLIIIPINDRAATHKRVQLCYLLIQRKEKKYADRKSE